MIDKKVNKLVVKLIDTLQSLDDTITQLEDTGINVSFFHEKGNVGRFTDSVSDRIILASVLECRTLYDAKSNFNAIEKVNNDATDKTQG